MKFFVIIRDRIMGLLRPDLDTLLGTFTRLQTKLQAFIDRELEALRADTDTLTVIQNRARLRNANIDRAYRTIHNLDTLASA